MPSFDPLAFPMIAAAMLGLWLYFRPRYRCPCGAGSSESHSENCPFRKRDETR